MTPKEETKPKEQKPKDYAPATDEAKIAISKLKSRIKALGKKIGNVFGKAKGNDLATLSAERAQAISLLNKIQAQNNVYAALVAKAREFFDAGKTDEVEKMNAELTAERQKLTDLIPKELPEKKSKENRPKKEKATKAKSDKKSTEMQPKTPPATVTTQQTTVQPTVQPQTQTPPAETTASQAETSPTTPAQKTQPQQSESQPVAQPKKQPSPETKRQEPTPTKTQPKAETKPAEPKPEQREENEPNNRNGRIFESVEVAEKRMLESLKEIGIEPLEKEDTRRPKLVDFVDDSDEALERAIAKWNKAANKLSANAIFDPDLWTAGLEIGAIYVQRGINKFADWAKKMTETLGKDSEPWQSAIWETINTLPEGSKFNERQITSIAGYIGSLQEDGTISSLEDVQTRFEQKIGKEATEKISPMIEASYKGIQKFFADRAAEQENQSKSDQTQTQDKNTENTPVDDESETNEQEPAAQIENIEENEESTAEQPDNEIEENEEPTEDVAEKRVAESDESEQVQPSPQGELVYPDGALTFGDKSAVDEFKGGYKDKNFDENNQREVTINGENMTRLEAVEGMAKGKLDESAMKLNKRETEYLGWLRKNLLEPLKKIQQAGIQNEQASKIYDGTIDGKNVYFEDIEQDKTTLNQLTKLAEAFGGTAEKNNSGNTLFKFATPADAWAFKRVADLFMRNVHLDYFNSEAVQGTKQLRAIVADKNQPADVRAQAALELNPNKLVLPDGAKPTRISIQQKSKDLWCVKVDGKFPNRQALSKIFSQLFGVVKTLDGRFDNDGTFHFKDQRDATAFKTALDIFFGFKKAPKKPTRNRPFIDNVDALFNVNPVDFLRSAPNLPSDLVEQVKSLGEKVNARLKAGTLTQAEAEKIASDLMDEFDKIGKQFDAGTMNQAEAQESIREAVDKINKQLSQDVETKPNKQTSPVATDTEITETPSEDKALDLFSLFGVEMPQNPSEDFQKNYRAMQDAWNDYLNGDIDIFELKVKAKEIVDNFKNEEYSRRLSELIDQTDKIWDASREGEISSEEADAEVEKLRNDFTDTAPPSVKKYLEENSTLRELYDKIKEIKLSPELQKLEDDAWNAFFILKRTFAHMRDTGKISDDDDDEYKKTERQIYTQLQEKVQNGKLTAYSAFRRLREMLPNVTEADIKNYLSTANPRKESTMFRLMSRDFKEAVNVFYDGSLIDEDALDISIESGAWDELMAKLPEHTKAELIRQAKINERSIKEPRPETKQVADKTQPALKAPKENESATEPEKTDEKSTENVNQSVFPGISDDVTEDQIFAANNVARTFLSVHRSDIAGTKELREHFEKAIGAENTQKIMPVIDSAEIDDLMRTGDFSKEKKASKAQLDRATERLKETFGLQTKQERQQERERQKLHEKWHTDTYKNLGTWIDNAFATIERDPNSEKAVDAQYNLSGLRMRDFTDELSASLDKKAKELNERGSKSATNAETVPKKTQSSQPKKGLQLLHDKLKTDSHPNLKSWLDDKLTEAATPEGKKVNAYLKQLEKQNLSDQALDNAEENLRRAKENLDRNRRNTLNRDDISEQDKQEISAIFDAKLKEVEQSLNFNYPSGKYTELKQKISQMTDEKLRAEAEDFLKYFDTNFEKELKAVSDIEELIRRDKENQASANDENASEKLTPKEKIERTIDNAVDKLKAAHNFSNQQIKGIDRLGGVLKSNGSITVADLGNEVDFFNEIFDGKLAEVINELNGYFNEEVLGNGEESGTGKRSDDGHRNVESAVRGGTDEETRTQGRAENVGIDSGQERQNESGLGENVARPNAENARPVQADDAGSASSRTGTGTGVRGNSEAVQPAAGTERGNANVSGNDENVTTSEKPTKPYEAAGHNFHITEDSGVGEGGLKEKFKQNIEAIKLLKQIEGEGRKATPSEQEILAKFNGWGTLASAFSNNPKWANENQQLRELLTPEEYEAAHGAIGNSYYTSPEIARTIWSGLERLGFKGGRILDPSMGNGIFFGTMPTGIMAQSELIGIDKDILTGRIAQQLYQDADVGIMPYQERLLPDDYFDLAISNVPFGDLRIIEDPNYRKEKYQLHDYFFAKSMDKVRPGGLVVFITSVGTLNNPTALFERFDSQADLIAAYKLPSNSFQKNANTQVTSDIVIFQKRLNPNVPSEHSQQWQNVGQIKLASKKDSGRKTLVKINEYFERRPSHMIGEPTIDTLWAGGNRLALDGKGRDVTKELGDLINKLPESIYMPIQREKVSSVDSTIAKILGDMGEDGNFAIDEGRVFQKLNGNVVEITGKDAQTVKDYTKLQKTLDALLKAELDPATTDEKISTLRKNLNQKYDDFVKKNSYLNAPKNVELLSTDLNFGRVAAIENYQYDKKTKTATASKTDIFNKRLVSPIKEPTTAATAIDGLQISLSMRGKIDMQYISDLTGKSESELERDLGDKIYRNPKTDLHELAEEYLSGNVRQKLAEAQEAAKKNPAFKRNVEALQKVQPTPYTEDDIAPHLGATWINPKYYEEFVYHLLGEENTRDVKIDFSPVSGAWFVQGSSWSSEYYRWQSVGANKTFNFFAMLELALNNKGIVINDKDKKVDIAATAAANEKLAQLRKAFEEWVWTDENRKAELLEAFNAEFNSEVLREYDGSHLTFPTMAQDVREKLYPHQKDVIWRMLQGQNTLIAHCVGAGKTWAMVGAAMEMKRLGIIKKPLFTVPNNIVKQFEEDFRVANPSARLLVLTSDMLPAANLNNVYTEKLNLSGRMQAASRTKLTDEKEIAKESVAQRAERLSKRAQILSSIRMNDWDGIIISHNLFERLPVSFEAQQEFYAEQKKIIKEELDNLQKTGRGGTTYEKALQHAYDFLEQLLKADLEEARKEICLSFEELGIDQIFVDEADMFKNLGYQSNLLEVKPGETPTVGLAATNAKRSTDMYLKTKVLTKMRNGKGGIVFATGTPISNTLAEIFTMQRYLDYKTMEEKKTYHFDNWINNFGYLKPSVELSPDARRFSCSKSSNINKFAGTNENVREVRGYKNA